jgi:hypothetical protein
MCHVGFDAKYPGRNDHRAHASMGERDDIAEATKEATAGGEIDAELFAGFADGGGDEIGVGGGVAPARQGDVARPGVAGVRRAADEEQREAGGCRGDDGGDGGADGERDGESARRAAREGTREVVEVRGKARVGSGAAGGRSGSFTGGARDRRWWR